MFVAYFCPENLSSRDVDDAMNTDVYTEYILYKNKSFGLHGYYKLKEKWWRRSATNPKKHYISFPMWDIINIVIIQAMY